MILVLKKGASKREIRKLGKRLVARRRVDITKYCGKITLKEDPLQIQQLIRNEWS